MIFRYVPILYTVYKIFNRSFLRWTDTQIILKHNVSTTYGRSPKKGPDGTLLKREGRRRRKEEATFLPAFQEIYTSILTISHFRLSPVCTKLPLIENIALFWAKQAHLDHEVVLLLHLAHTAHYL